MATQAQATPFPTEAAINRLSRAEFLATSLIEQLEKSQNADAWKHAQLAEKIQAEISALEQDILRHDLRDVIADDS